MAKPKGSAKIWREMSRPFRQINSLIKRPWNRYKNKHKLAIWGWWQGQNLGDNWIRHVMSQNFPEAICVETNEYDIEQYGFVICGGGGLFVKEVIPPWNRRKIKVPYGMLGLGVEFQQTLNHAHRLAENAKFFFVRDQESIERMNLSRIDRSYDVTFSFPLRFVDENELDMDKALFAWSILPDLFVRSEFCEYIQNDSNPHDWLRIFGSQFKEVNLDDFHTTDHDIESRFEGHGFVVSSRFHGVVASIQKGIPFIAIDASPKIRDIMRDSGLEEYCIKYDQINQISGLIAKAKDNFRSIREKQKTYRERAHKKIIKDVLVAKNEVAKYIFLRDI